MARSGNAAHQINTPFRTILVILICVLGMGGSLYLFRRDMNASQRHLDEKPIAEVYWIDGTVQRLSTRHPQWERLDRFSPIFDGDTISTAPFSELKLKFINGETLQLSENTSVLIKYQTDELSGFALQKGEIQVDTDRSSLEITLAENAAADLPAGSAVKVIIDPKTSTDLKTQDGIMFKLLQGSGSISSGADSRTLAEGEALRIEKDGTFSTPLPVVMLSPRNETRLLRTSPEEAPVKFTWKKTDSAVILEIAGSKDFSNQIGSWYVEGSDSKEIDLPVGTYYWKVCTAEKQDDTDTGKLEIAYTPGPKALSPSDGSFVTTQSGKDELRFSWNVPEEAESVLLEVADNPAMTRPRLRQLVKKTSGGAGSFITTEIKAGKWYWRVYPVYPGGISETDFSSGQGSAQGFFRVRPENADVIADDLPSPVNSFTLAEAREAARTGSGAITRNFEPGSSPRIIFPPDNYSLETSRTPDLFFSWKNPNSFKARFQIAERSDFAGSLTADETVFGSTTRGPFLKPGIYYWRVVNADSTGQEGTPTRLVIIPSLDAPKLEFPRENERVLIEEGKAVNFSWDRVGYENYYVFMLYLEGKPQALAEVSSLQNNSVMVYFDAATTGQFRWTVQGFKSPTETSSGRTGLIAQSNFTIVSQTSAGRTDQIAWTTPRIVNIQTRSGDVRSPITLVSPASGINVPGIQATRTPLQAWWSTEEPLKNAQLIVSQLQDPSSDPRAIVKDAGTPPVTFPSLSEGIWYWIIRGDTRDERGATPGDPFWLKVLPIPLLPAFQPDQPQDGDVIGIEELTRDRKISFKWEPVAGANAYIFSLLTDNQPPTLLITAAPENVYSYDLENLTILNQGSYLWQVEAVYLNENGTIEQRGKIEQHRFTVDIRHSTDLQTRTQGTMYGH